METDVDPAGGTTRRAPRKVHRWTAVLFAIEVVVVIGLVLFSWTSGSWT